MKTIKFAFTLLLLFVAVFGSAQEQRLYNCAMKLDKFDDVVWKKQIKTLILKTDTTFIIETKGQKPVEYWYLDQIYWSARNGSQDSIVNITNDVYGYEVQYYAYTKEIKEEALKEAIEEAKEKADPAKMEDYIKLLTEYKIAEKFDELPTLTHRVISKYRYMYEYDKDMFWVSFPDGSRTVYLNMPR